MIVNLDRRAQEALGRSELVIITERVDDVALLLGQMLRMGLVEVLDEHLPRHGRQRALSWGWTAAIWLGYILSEGDHRKVSMEHYIAGMQQTLSTLSGQVIEPLDFSDDRLGHLLKHLSQRAYWQRIEASLTERSIELYELEAEVIRCDATTVSGDHAVVEGGLFQFGHSKDDPSRGQLKLMAGTVDPLGMPLATDVVSGERADDGLYGPLIARIDRELNRRGLLFVGDSKMSALETRAELVRRGHYYLSPLPLTGTTAREMDFWIDDGLIKAAEGTLETVYRTDESGEQQAIAWGYEFERECGLNTAERSEAWHERVLVIHSGVHAQRQAAGLEKRLASAAEKLQALTPPRGRGKRQLSEEAAVIAGIEAIVKAQRVEGLLSVHYERHCERQRKYIGRGRGSAQREQRVEQKVRYQITAIERQEAEISALKARYGWKAFVTNSASSQLSLAQAVIGYRNEYRVERVFQRLKSRLNIAPLFVQRDDQVQGLTYLLTLGVRVLTLVEFVVRRSLQHDNATLAQLHAENKKKTTLTPTSERLLKAFSGLTLTIIKDHLGRELIRQFNQTLSPVQQDILRRLGLDAALYQQLEFQNRAIS
jgi:transposase